MGVPPVAVRSSAVNDMISSGQDGLLVPAEVEPFARAMGELLAEPRRREAMGERAREKARQFSAESCARRLARLYEDVINKSRQEKSARGGSERP